MKKLLISSIFIAGLISCCMTISVAQMVVKIKPPAPVIVRTAMPGPGLVWIGNEWRWDKKTAAYVMVTGAWVKPPHGKHWVDGHWKRTRDGYKWIPGHWHKR